MTLTNWLPRVRRLAGGSAARHLVGGSSHRDRSGTTESLALWLEDLDQSLGHPATRRSDPPGGSARVFRLPTGPIIDGSESALSTLAAGLRLPPGPRSLVDDELVDDEPVEVEPFAITTGFEGQRNAPDRARPDPELVARVEALYAEREQLEQALGCSATADLVDLVRSAGAGTGTMLASLVDQLNALNLDREHLQAELGVSSSAEIINLVAELHEHRRQLVEASRRRIRGAESVLAAHERLLQPGR